MTNRLLKFFRPVSLTAILFAASLSTAQAFVVTPDMNTSPVQSPIILLPITHDEVPGTSPKKIKKDVKPKKIKKDVNAKKKNPWAVQCGEDPKTKRKFCRMQQSLRFKKTGQRLLAVVIQPQIIEPKIAILLSLPHGLYLPAGAAFKIDDGKETRMIIETCDVEGCYASGGLSEEQVAAMKKGNKLRVAFMANNKKPINIPVDLSGFTAAYKKITKSK